MSEFFRKAAIVLSLASMVLMLMGGNGYVFALFKSFLIYSFGWWAVMLALLTVLCMILHLITKMPQSL